jgi:uncharacterized protein YceH (UPF0502 family)
MLDLKGIKKTLKKLKDTDEPGELVVKESGQKENRYSYLFDGKMEFTFGITRSSKAKSKRFSYIPGQMGLKRSEYKLLHDCPMSKKDYNNKLIELSKS